MDNISDFPPPALLSLSQKDSQNSLEPKNERKFQTQVRITRIKCAASLIKQINICHTMFLQITPQGNNQTARQKP
jgi:hypothetical protein